MVEVFVDGACTGNPGPMGIGCVFVKNGDVKFKHSAGIGNGTNNIAELSAIKFALMECLRRKAKSGTTGTVKERLVVYSDSMYCVNSVNGVWNGDKNFDLIHEIKGMMRRFDALIVVHIKRCSVSNHKLADKLAKKGAEQNRSHKWIGDPLSNNSSLDDPLW